MFLTCPECSTKFTVADDAIPEMGRKVKCGSCSHVWHQEPMPAEVKEEIEEVKKSQSENLKQAVAEKAQGIEPQLPIVFINRPAPFLLKLAAIAMLLLNICGFVYFNKDKIQIEFLYSMIGQPTSEGLVIDKVIMLDPFITEDDVTHYIDWTIKNTAEETRQIPKARFSLLNKSREIVEQSTGSKSGEILAEGEYKFKAIKFEDIGKKGRYLLIEIGNSLELSSR